MNKFKLFLSFFTIAALAGCSSVPMESAEKSGLAKL